LAETFSDPNKARGEIVLMISGVAALDQPQYEPKESSETSLVKRMAQLQQDGLDEKAALKQAAREMGLKRDEAYRLLVAQKNRGRQ
jgi:16S rRNA C1402 (ribose-2'-O) methylase RsmI